MLADKAKEAIVSAVIVSATALLALGWHSLTDKRGVPEWAGYVAVVVVGLLTLGVWGKLSRRLTEAERYILGAMRTKNEAFIVRASGAPNHVQAGGIGFYGGSEQRGGIAPVAEKYLDAFERLKAHGYLREFAPESPTWVLTSKGTAKAQALGEKYLGWASDICYADVPAEPDEGEPFPLTDAESYLLAARYAQRLLGPIHGMGKPRCIHSGDWFFAGPNETHVSPAPIAAKYLAAFDRLKARGLLTRVSPQSAGNDYQDLTEEGYKAEAKLAPQFRAKPPDIL